MKNRKVKPLTGYIKFQNKVKAGSQECYGVTRAAGSKWGIRISRDASHDFYVFSETVIHELIHLGFFIIMACSTRKWTERVQHKMIDRIMPLLIKELKKHK